MQTTTHIKSEDWHQREAAVMAFGSILEGLDPSVLMPLVNQALLLLIDMMHDGNAHMKDTTVWTLGRICDLLIAYIKPDVHLHPLVSALVGNLQDTPSASNEANFRTSAYEAITSYSSHATLDTIVVMQNMLITIHNCMEQLLSMQNQILGVDDRHNWNELQSNFCSVVICVIRKLEKGIQPLSDRIMTLILQLIQATRKTSTVLEDAFLIVGSLASALESNFAPYISAFLPFLYPALKVHKDTQLCTVAVGIIGNISRALGEQSMPFR
ncbi:hypothetical protein H0H92_005155 [Tricholoma furcatifolium]|nr:hypothetical protein H0H92_005155 [Tricholoma furcatifolium]